LIAPSQPTVQTRFSAIRHSILEDANPYNCVILLIAIDRFDRVVQEVAAVPRVVDCAPAAEVPINSGNVPEYLSGPVARNGREGRFTYDAQFT
jgi:hypothetical protein